MSLKVNKYEQNEAVKNAIIQFKILLKYLAFDLSPK